VDKRARPRVTRGVPVAGLVDVELFGNATRQVEEFFTKRAVDGWPFRIEWKWPLQCSERREVTNGNPVPFRAALWV
jgi:hypothetical protein